MQLSHPRVSCIEALFVIQEIWRKKTSAPAASIWIGCVQDARKGMLLLRKIAFLPGSREKRTGGPRVVIEDVH